MGRGGRWQSIVSRIPVQRHKTKSLFHSQQTNAQTENRRVLSDRTDQVYVNQLFPDFLFEDLRLVTLLAYCISRLSPALTKRLFEGKAISLQPNETLILRPHDPHLRMSAEELQTCLVQLQELDIISVATHDRYFLVKCRLVPVPVINEVVDGGQISNESLPQISFQAFVADYLDHVRRNLAPKTLENYERVTQHAIKHFGTVLLNKLTPRHLEDYKTFRKEDDGVSNTTINMDVRCLKAALEHAIVCGYLEENPFRCIKPMRGEKQISRIVSKEDWSDLMMAEDDENLRRLFTFAALTGLRRGEITNLEWKDIDFEKKLITVQSSLDYRVKHGKARIVPMSPTIETLLRSMERSDVYAFVGNGGEKYRDDFVTKRFKRAIRAAELDDRLKLHCLRHTSASWMAMEGVGMVHIKELLGHAYLKTTEAYTQIPTEELRKAAGSITLPPVSTNNSARP